MSIEICRIILQSDYNYQQKKESCRVSGQFVHSFLSPAPIVGKVFCKKFGH